MQNCISVSVVQTLHGEFHDKEQTIYAIEILV